MTTRRMVLLRHAKAAEEASSDIERALTDEGRGDARAAGAWVRGRRRHPYGLALVSTARRARETYGQVLEGGAAAEDMWSEPRLYQAGPECYLRVLTEVPGHVQRLLVVAHSPGLAQAALMLADKDASDPEAYAATEQGMKTCGMVVLETETPWEDITPGCARIVLTHTSRAGDPEDAVLDD